MTLLKFAKLKGGEAGGVGHVCCVVWRQCASFFRRGETKWEESLRGAYLFSVIASAHTHARTHTATRCHTTKLACVRGDTHTQYVNRIMLYF